MGLTRERMEDGDALFFHQLLVPFVEPPRSGIPDNPRSAFYMNVAKFTNTYAFGMRECSEDYGHPFRPCLAEELVNWDGIVTRNLNNYVGNNWRREYTNQYDPLIVNTMSLTRWLDLKRNMKLCDYPKEIPRDEVGYDPSGKYCLIWDV